MRSSASTGLRFRVTMRRRSIRLVMSQPVRGELHHPRHDGYPADDAESDERHPEHELGYAERPLPGQQPQGKGAPRRAREQREGTQAQQDRMQDEAERVIIDRPPDIAAQQVRAAARHAAAGAWAAGRALEEAELDPQAALRVLEG